MVGSWVDDRIRSASRLLVGKSLQYVCFGVFSFFPFSCFPCNLFPKVFLLARPFRP
ncbi:unnamed protein product [Arabidopsis halleri]